MSREHLLFSAAPRARLLVLLPLRDSKDRNNCTIEKGRRWSEGRKEGREGLRFACQSKVDQREEEEEKEGRGGGRGRPQREAVNVKPNPQHRERELERKSVEESVRSPPLFTMSLTLRLHRSSPSAGYSMRCFRYPNRLLRSPSTTRNVFGLLKSSIFRRLPMSPSLLARPPLHLLARSLDRPSSVRPSFLSLCIQRTACRERMARITRPNRFTLQERQRTEDERRVWNPAQQRSHCQFTEVVRTRYSVMYLRNINH